MSARVDGIQVALPRAVTDAAQQHAAQRQPVIAQEQATEVVKGQARAREQRPGAVHGGDGGRVREELVESTTDARDDGAGQSRNRRQRRLPAAPTTSTEEPGRPAGEALPPPADGKGRRVDLRL